VHNLTSRCKHDSKHRHLTHPVVCITSVTSATTTVTAAAAAAFVVVAVASVWKLRACDGWGEDRGWRVAVEHNLMQQ